MTRRIELSPRLRLAADLVPEGARLADVGTDHAYLPACLLMEGKIPSAIAADLREGPLSRARETAAEYGCGDRMAFRLCDGLSGIRPEKTDAVVIAGMGGETIAQILEAAPWVRTRKIPLVLQPMSSIPELRQRLEKVPRAFRRREGERLLLAFPLEEGRPFPLETLFCLARVLPVEGRLCAVYAFDREGRPLPP